MTTSVDTRVVEMKFDNASFQRGVAETLASLENLSGKLDNGTTYSGLDKFKSAIRGISFDSIGSGLETLFSKASSVFGGLTNIVSTFTKGLLGISGIAGVLMAGGGILQAITGGSQRATNIENARFQLQGLHADWETISEDINYAVLDTAYGFDAAAMAAAQFTASGVEAGDAMKVALRGISGVAAMTNSSYEDISRIFTTVAGNGRLMGDQLLQLSSRGLNVAAILGQQLHVSEEEVRDMVSKGMISFDAFASAMDEAFGTHAKEANSTFTGAISNMKAALNKIGADFIAPIHEFERQGALGLKAIFDAIRKGLELEMDIEHLTDYAGNLKREFAGTWSIVSTFSHNAEILGARIQKAFTGFAESGVIQEAVTGWFWLFDAWADGTRDIVGNLVESIFSKLSALDLSPMSKALQNIGERAYLFVNQLAETVPTIVDILGNLIGAFFNVVGTIGSFILPVFKAFGDVVFRLMDIGADGTNKFLENLQNWSQGLQDFTATFSLSAEQMEAVRTIFGDIFSGIATVVGPFLTLIHNFISAIGGTFANLWPAIDSFAKAIGSVLGPALEKGTEILGSFISVLAEFVSKIPDFVKEFLPIEDIAKFFDSFNNVVSTTFSSIDITGIIGVFESLKETFSKTDINTDFLKGAGKSITDFFDSITKSSSGLTTATTFFDRLLDIINKFQETDQTFANEGMKGIIGVLHNADVAVKDIGETFLGTLSSIATGIEEFISSFTYEDLVTAISAVLTGLMVGTGLKFANSINTIVNAVASGIEGITGVIESAAGVLDSIGESVTKFAKSLNKQATAEVIKSIGLSIALLAGSLFLISLIDSDKLLVSLAVFTAIVLVLAGLMAAIAALSKWMTKGMTDKQMATFAAQLSGFAVAIGVLAGSIAVLSASVALLSLLDPIRMWSAVGAIVVLMGLMIGLSAVVGHIKASYSSLLAFAAAMMSLGLAIIPLVAAITLLSFLPWQQVLIGIGELALILWAVEEVLSTLSSNLMRGDAANIAAFAAVLLAIGLAIIPLVGAVVVLSSIPFPNIIQGLLALAGVMVALGTAIGIMSKLMQPKTAAAILAASTAIMAFGVSMIGVAAAVAIISALPLEGVQQAVDALQQILISFTLLSLITTLFATGGSELLGMSSALTSFAVAVIAIAGALAVLSLIPVENLAAGVIALVVVLAAFVGIGALLTKVIPGAAGALIVFGYAILLAGAGIALVGVGLMAFAAGLSTLAMLGPAAAESIGTAMVIMAQKSAEAIVTFIQTLAEASPQVAESSGKIGKAAAHGFADAAPEFANAGVQAIIAFANGLGQMAGSLAASGLLIITNFLLGIAEGIGQVIDAAVNVALMFIIGLADGLRNNIDIIEAAVVDLFASIGSVLLTLLADLLDTIGLGFTGIPDQIRGAADDMAAAAEESSQAAHTKFSEAYGDITSDTDNMVDDVTSTISDGSDDAGAASEDMAYSMFDGFDGIMGMLPDEAKENVGGVIDAITGMSDGAFDAGELIGQSEGGGTAAGIESKTSEVMGASQSLVDAAGSVNASGAGEAVGSSFGSGLASGIGSWVSSVAEKARELVRQAKAAADAEADSHSPSKEMIKRGQWFGQGYEIGILNTITDVVNASTRMVSSGKTAVEDSIISMSDMFDDINWDLSPVVTPVLDASQIEDGMSRISGLFPETQLITASTLDRGVSMNTRALDASGNTRYGDQYNFNLQYDAGADATDIVMGMARSMRTRSLLEA